MSPFVGIIIVCFSVVSSSYAVEQCVKRGPCSCAFSDGSGIDLTPSAAKNFTSAQSFVHDVNETKLYTYYFHPCDDVIPPIPKAAANVPNECTVVLQVCRNVVTMTKDNTTNNLIPNAGQYDFIGDSKETTFTMDGSIPSIVYNHGPSPNVTTTIVRLLCATADDDLKIISLVDPRIIILGFYSHSACLKQVESVRSLGSTLLIVFFSCALFYLVLGVCTKKFLMGATGIEVVPNLAFWTDLPNLVKDGWAFAISGFKLPARAAHVTSPDPNSYDSI